MMEVKECVFREKIAYRSNSVADNIAIDLRVLAALLEPSRRIVAIRSRVGHQLTRYLVRLLDRSQQVFFGPGD
jgi:hypothetical protein